MESKRERVEAMSALDALLFRGDEHPRMLSVVGGLYLLDGEPARRRMMQSLDRASRAFPRLRQRVVVPPLRLVLPHWVTDPGFVLADHVRYVRVEAPGSLTEVLDAVRPELSAPLDPDRPLWEALLMTGLEGRQCALLFRMSHAMTDGIGAIRMLEALFDDSPAPARKRMPPPPPAGMAEPTDVQARAFARMPQEAIDGAVRALPGLFDAVLSATRDPVSFVRSTEKQLASLRRVLSLPCSPARALSGRGYARRCMIVRVPLPALKRASRKLESSVNDLYLAAIAGALRRYQSAVGVDPEDVPVAVPVNLRRGDESAPGNYIGALTLAAPASEPDVSRRLAAIRQAVRAGRAEPAIQAHSSIAPLLARMPDTVLERLLASIPRADVQASNVPGPATRPFFAGRRVRAVYPFGPVPGVGAMITMLSLADECFVAVHFDPASFARPETFASCLRRGFTEVLEAGGQSAMIAEPILDHGAP